MGLAKQRLMPLLAVALLAQACFVDAQGLSKYNLTQPLRVCTASIQDFGARCNGAPTLELEDAEEPDGPVPIGGWCANGEDFCGYDVDVWSEIADQLGLEEGRDFERVCLGERGFSYMLESLAGENRTFSTCDVGVSSITASRERENRGISFSRATQRSALAILVHAPLKQRGMWAFFEPLHFNVWMALLGTIIVTPFFVFFFEAVFSKWTTYMRGDTLDVVSGLLQCLWHSVSHTLSIDVFCVTSLPARIITAAYAFLVLILTNTYTANLAAFLTVDQLDTTISSVADLRGKAVATVQPYLSRLYQNQRIVASTQDGWDYDLMVQRLRRGEYAAVISDDTQLVSRAFADDTCSLHILSETIEPFDLAIAFRRDFPSDPFRFAVSSAILHLQEDGTLSEIKDDHQNPEPRCASEATEFSETNQVQISSLWGLWIILASAFCLAGLFGLIDYLLKRRRKHEDVQKIHERVNTFGSAFRRVVSVQHAASAFWMTIDRTGSGTAPPGGGSAASGITADARAGRSEKQASSTLAAAGHPNKTASKKWRNAFAAHPGSKDLVGRHATLPATDEARGDVGGGTTDTCAALRSPQLHATASMPRNAFASDSSGAVLGGPSVTTHHSESAHSSEILDVFVPGPAMLDVISRNGDVAPVAMRRTLSWRNRQHSGNSGRAMGSRQSSLGYGTAAPGSGGGDGAVGSLGVCSMGARSDCLDAPIDTPSEPDAAASNSQSIRGGTSLPGLPSACMECTYDAPAAEGAASEDDAGASGIAAANRDLDTDLEELHGIVQMVANRVSVLRLARQQRRRQ